MSLISIYNKNDKTNNYNFVYKETLENLMFSSDISSSPERLNLFKKDIIEELFELEVKDLSFTLLGNLLIKKKDDTFFEIEDDIIINKIKDIYAESCIVDINSTLNKKAKYQVAVTAEDDVIYDSCSDDNMLKPYIEAYTWLKTLTD